MNAPKDTNCHLILGGKYELCNSNNGAMKLRIATPKTEIPSKLKDTGKRGMGQQLGKINAPTFAYRTIYNKDPPEILRGRSDAPKREWNGIYVDEGLKDEWLEDLNSLPVEIRSTEEGKSELRPAFVIFRMTEMLDELNNDMLNHLQTQPHLYVKSDIGQGGRPRICVANKITKYDDGWEEWWEELPNKINSAYEKTLEKNGMQFTFNTIHDFKNKYIQLAKENKLSCDIIEKDTDIVGDKKILVHFNCKNSI